MTRRFDPIAKKNDLEAFRHEIRAWLQATIPPNWHETMADADERRFVEFQRDWFVEMKKVGLGTPHWPKDWGGPDLSLRHQVIIFEEIAQMDAPTADLYTITLYHLPATLFGYGTPAQRERYLKGALERNEVWCQGFSEPNAGSDLASLRTRAERKGDSYVVNGSKIFITNGYLAELIALVVKTTPGEGAKGTSILMVETRDLPGYRVGRILDKMGLKAQDTAELFFENVRVPAANLLGGTEGQGFYQLMSDLPYERALIAVVGVGAMEGALLETARYVKERKAFGRSVAEFQNTKFKLAEIATKTRVARVFVDDCIERIVAGTLDTVTASMAKYWVTDTQQEVLDECVQLHGGYGYMNEYLVCRMFVDSRVQRIYGGTNEIMKELISRSI